MERLGPPVPLEPAYAQLATWAVPLTDRHGTIVGTAAYAGTFAGWGAPPTTEFTFGQLFQGNPLQTFKNVAADPSGIAFLVPSSALHDQPLSAVINSTGYKLAVEDEDEGARFAVTSTTVDNQVLGFFAPSIPWLTFALPRTMPASLLITEDAPGATDSTAYLLTSGELGSGISDGVLDHPVSAAAVGTPVVQSTPDGPVTVGFAETPGTQSTPFLSAAYAANLLTAIATDMREPSPGSGAIGVAVQTAVLARSSTAPDGTQIMQTAAGGAAAIAGLHVGDVVTRVDNTPTPTASQFVRIIRDTTPGTMLHLHVIDTTGRSFLPRVGRMAARRHAFLFPIAAGVLTVAICSLLPASLSDSLGTTLLAPDGSRQVEGIRVLNFVVWASFGRLSYLPLLVGVWEGMEIARACYALTNRRWVTASLVKAVRWRPTWLLAVVLLGLAVGGAFLIDQPLLVLAGVELASIVVLAVHGRMPHVTVISSLRTYSSHLAFSTDWRNAAPIALVLLVLTTPIYVPLGIDLWNGVQAPFRLPDDAIRFIYFWRYYGVAQASEISIPGIVEHGVLVIAEVAAGIFALLIAGFIISGFSTSSQDRRGLRTMLWFCVRVAAIAFVPKFIIAGAERPETAAIVALCAAPAILLIERFRVSISDGV